MSKRKKRLVLAAVVAAVVVAGVAAAAKGRNKTVAVKIEPVVRRDLVASVTAAGKVEPHTKVDVSSDITGRITRLAVKEGDHVRKGQFLLEIDPSQYRAAAERAAAAVASARAQTAQARANLLQAERNHDRVAEMKRRNPALVSDDQLDQLRTAVAVNKALLENATHGVDQAQAALRDAQSALAKTVIVAPMTGQITRLNVEQGETAIMGTLNKDAATLLTVSDMSDLETKVKVDETDVARINVGDSAIVMIDAFPDTTFRGRVTEISNSSVTSAPGGQGSLSASADQAVDYEVTVKLLNPPPDTRPDFSTNARIITATRRGALSIPIIALTVRDRGPSADTAAASNRRRVGQRDVEGVYVVGKDNRVTFRPVRVGIAGEQHFEVLSGLKEGERIVAGTYQAIRELRDSTAVRALPADKKNGAGRP